MIKTGIQWNFDDEILGGGFPEKHIVLLAGPEGIGKTIFGFEFLYNGAKFFEQGGSALFLFADRADWMSVSRISNYFPWISTAISLIFGSYRTLIAGSIYSAFMASLTVIMIYKMAKELLPDNKKSYAVDAAILAIFFPSFIVMLPSQQT